MLWSAPVRAQIAVTATLGRYIHHTWVTAYDSRTSNFNSIDEILVHWSSFWFCYGDFHSSGSCLGEQIGDVSLAKCLVEPNVDSWNHDPAKGTIFTYGWDGICHQVANQVLFATALGATNPLMVKAVRGYGKSQYIYGDYGRNTGAWKNRIKNCRASNNASQGGGGAVGRGDDAVLGLARETMRTNTDDHPETSDDFEIRARVILGSDKIRLFKLLDLRAGAQKRMDEAFSNNRKPSPDELNALQHEMLLQVADLIGPWKFEELFGFPADEDIKLIDPSFAEK
jgi:hypothetical protein